MADNVFEEIGHETKVVAEDIGHVFVEAVEFPDKAAKVISTIVKDDAPLKAELIVLLNQCKATLSDGVQAATDKGLDFIQDEKTVVDIDTLAKYVTETIVPAIESVYNELNTDVS